MTLDSQDIEFLKGIVAVNSTKEVLTFEEAMMFLGIKRTKLMSEKHKIGYSQQGKSIYFLRKDLINYASSNRRASEEEIKDIAANFLGKSKRRLNARE